MSGHATINRFYRLIWSATQGAWVAVAETTRGRGKGGGGRRLAPSLFAALFGGMFAGPMAALAQAAPIPAPTQLPTGATVVGGAVNISQNGAAMTVRQSTQRGAIDWQTFNVGSGARVDFAQPSAGAVTLNRVLDSQASQIFGQITANGQVFLSNPNGVYFSPTASVDVGGLVATTHSIGTADFMAGKNTFKRDGATGAVINDGTLQAGLGGYIALLAPEVRNNGLVLAQAGTVALAAGDAIELQFGGSGTLAGVLVRPSAIAALVDNGSAVHAPGGLIIMSAQAASQLQGGIVRNSGSLEAGALSERGGKIVLDASGLVDNSGKADVSGTVGGAIAITADRMLNSGSLLADGQTRGGGITSELANGLLETTSALVSAQGGGSIAVDGGAGQVYTSGSYRADGLGDGQRGGSVTLTGASVMLMGASASANGAAGGGQVLVGGDYQGGKNSGTAPRNATTTTVGQGVTLSADALENGDGGKVVVWSDRNTAFSGTVTARGGAAGGDGGVLEVSGKQELHFAGAGNAHAPHGASGTLLLDPKDIYIDDKVTAQLEYVNPHPTADGTFGAGMVQLTSTSGATVTPTGYTVITNPTDNLAAANGGAVYLFRDSDRALVSTLYGDHAGDKVGYIPNYLANTAITTLANGNFTVSSPLWNDGRGAVTWGSGTAGWGGTATAVSSSNSLVGTLTPFVNSHGDTVSDAIGSYNNVVTLPNGNYVVKSAAWGNLRGAVAFGDGASGSAGVIGASNALVGSTPISQLPGGQKSYLNGDQVSGVTVLPNSNYIVSASMWSKGVGAVALGSGTGGLVGAVSAANALVGDITRFDAVGDGNGTDKIGEHLQVLTGNEFIAYTNSWNAGSGAVTWSAGATLPVGLVSAANSLVGAAGDNLSSGGIQTLGANHAYVISSPIWGSGKGAATWVPYGADVKDIVLTANSVTGSANGDAIGSKDVTLLSNNDYVLSSPGWTGGYGAVTLVDGTTGKTKVGQSDTVGAANSIVGSQTTDKVGQNGIVELAGNGNFVALSPFWTNGSVLKAGAVTWSSGTSAATVGAVSSSNSLVGTHALDRVGETQYTSYDGNDFATDHQSHSITPLSNGNYVVASPMWDGTRGAVTLSDGATGMTVAGGQEVGAANSLVGNIAGDFAGAIASHTVNAPKTPYDSIGNGVHALSNGNFVVTSNYWTNSAGSNGTATHAGAVTFSSGASGGAPTVGAISASNSLVGSTTEDSIGAANGTDGFYKLLAGYDVNGKQLYSGNYVIYSGKWDNGGIVDAGAFTWGSGTTGVSGVISTANSVVGTEVNGMNSAALTPLAINGNYVIGNPYWDNGAATDAGAATWVDGGTGRVSDYAAAGNQNIVSAANSLVGTQTNDYVGGWIEQLYDGYSAKYNQKQLTGNYVALNTNWANGGLANAGAATWGDGSTGVRGTINEGNSILGQKAEDYYSSYYLGLSNGNYVIGNPTSDINGIANVGSVTWVDGRTGKLNDYAAAGNQNIVSAANSLVGSHAEDRIGDYYMAQLLDIGMATGANSGNGANYFIYSTNWNCLAGAITYVSNPGAPLIGVLGAANSVIGVPNGEFIGGLLPFAPNPVMLSAAEGLVTINGNGGRVYVIDQVMPAQAAMALAGATNYGDAAGGYQMITPDYVSNVLKTGTGLTLQANNDIYIKQAIDATGGVAGGGLTLKAGRSITVLGDIVTGNRDLTLVANDSVANGVVDGYRDAGVATIAMGADPFGHSAVIDAGTGTVSITLAAGADKTHHTGGSIGLNSVTAAAIKVANLGDGAGVMADLPDFSASCCGYTLGHRDASNDTVINYGAQLRATGPGDAVVLAANGNFKNQSDGNAIAITNPAGRWLVFANEPTADFTAYAGLDSGATAVWNTPYTDGATVTQTGNRYVFNYQPVITVGTQNVSKTYGTDLSAGTDLASQVISLSGAQPAVAGAYLGDTISSALSGNIVVNSTGSAARAAASATPYAINVDLSGVTGNNGYAVSVASGAAPTLTVDPKALGVAITSPIAKTYDGNTDAVLASADYTVTGVVSGDTVSVTKTAGSYNVAGVAATTVTATLAAGDYSGASGNYILPTSASGAGGIAPKALSATLTGVSKTYDGGAGATLANANYSLTGFVGGESATVGQTVGQYNSANVASATSVSATLASSDFTAGSGTALANYVLPTSASGAASIAPKALSTSLTGTISKTYDGTTSATLSGANYSVTGFVGGESATVSHAAGSYNDASVAGATSVSATLAPSDYTAASGTLLSNYTLPTTATGGTSVSITRAPLTITANDHTRTYDGTAYSGGNGVSYSGLVNSETGSVLGGSLVYGGTSQGAINVGGYAIEPSGLTSSNYQISYANGALTINPVQLIAITGSLTGTLGKVYDGTSTATLSGANYLLSGFVNGDGANVTKTTGSYDGANAGAHTVTVNLATSDYSPVGSTVLSNYTLPTSISASAQIAQKALSAALTGVSKTYDGNANALLSNANFSLSGFVGGESATVGQMAGLYNSANVVGATSASATLAPSDYSAASGTLLANYVLPASASGAASITAKALAASLTGVTKTYDGGATATLSNANYSVTGFVGADGVTVGQAAGTYNSAHVAGATSVSATLAGADYTATGATVLSNYVLPTSATGAATIAAKALTTTLTGSLGKTYDGGASATLGASNFSVTGFVGGESATVGQTVGQYNSANVASATSVSATLAPSDYTAASGTVLGDYVLPTSASGTAAIAPKALSTSLTGTISKTYDGTTSATLSGANYSVTGFVGGESATVSHAAGSYNDASVAGATSVSATLAPSDYTAASGTLLSNYTLPTTATGGTSVSITRAPLTITANDQSRTYDGTAYSGGNGVSYSGLVNSETGSVLGGSLVYGGTSQGAINVGGYAIVPSGLTSSNYQISYANGALTIDPVQLIAITGSLTGTLGKVYDGTSTATLSGANYLLSGFVNGDGANVTKTTGSYDGANAGAHTVTVNLATGDYAPVGSTVLSNYTLPTSISASAQIAQKALSAALTGVSKTYDGTAAALLNNTNFSLTGFVSGESATVNQTAGAYNAATVAGAGSASATLASGNYVAGSGTTLSNYVLPTSASGGASITPAPLTVTATDHTRVYDGTAYGGGNGVSYAGLVNNESGAVLGGSLVYGGTSQGAVNAGGYVIAPSGLTSSNYQINYVNGALTISAVPLVAITGSLVGMLDKVYDGTSAATLNSANYSLSGFVGGESATVTKTSGSYDGTGAGAHTITVNLAGGDYAAGGGTLLSNYILPTSISGSGQIAPKALSAALTGVTKTYDGGAAATLAPANYTLTGFAGSESATVGQTTGLYNSANVAGATSASATLAAGDYSAASGTLLSNYVLPTSASGAASITPKALNASLTGVTKTYDGGTAAALVNANYSLTGFVGADGATVGQTAGSYNSAHVAGATSASAALSSGDYTPTGATVLSNYVLPTTATGAASIGAKALAASLTGSLGKTYDGNANATLSAANFSLTGFAGAESATVGQTTGSYNAASVAGASSVGATLNPGHYTAGSSTALSDYVLPTSATGAAAIAPKALAASLTGVISKPYDGTTAATLSGANVHLTGFVGAESATVSQAAGVYNAASVAGATSVSATLAAGDYSAGNGTALSNYVLPTTAGGAAGITPAALLVSAANAGKTYDKVAYSGGNGVTYSGLVNNETSAVLGGTLSYTGTAQGALNAGAYTLTPGGYTSGNYTISYASGALTIAPRALGTTVTLNGAYDKVYDGASDVALTGASFSLPGLLSGDSIGINKTAASYDSADAGNRTISVALAPSDFAAQGATLLSNYVLPTGASAQAVIAPKTLTATVTGVSKIYDGGTSAALSGANIGLAGFVGGQSATVGQTAGSYNSADVLGANSVTAALGGGNVTAGGGTNLANYVLPATVSGAASIAPRALTATVSGAAKTYDGNTDITLTAANVHLDGFVAGQSASAGTTRGTLNSANVAEAGSVSVALAAGDFSGNGGTALSNYILPASATGAASVAPRALTASVVGASKTYDGGTGIALTAANVVLDGFVAGQSASIGGKQGSYNSANVAEASSVRVTLAAGDLTAGAGTLLSNYAVPASASGAASIAPRALTGALTGVSKVYDGGSGVALTGANVSLTGFVAGQSASVGALTGSYDSADVASATRASASLGVGAVSGNAGTLLSNYVLPASISGAASIAPRPLTATLDGAAISKVYDGTVSVALPASAVSLGGFVAGQSATVGQVAGQFDAASAGARTVAAALPGAAISAAAGTNLANYALPASTSTGVGGATIAPATLTVTAANASKVFDNVAYSGGNGVRYSGFVNGETSAVLGGALGYGGSAQGALNVGSYSISPRGLSSGNYTFNYVDGTLAIGKAALSVISASLIGELGKTYDGTTAATLDSGNFLLTGFAAGNGATVTQTRGSYDSANAGVRTLTVALADSDYAANQGTLLGNYQLPDSVTGTATIAPRQVTLVAPAIGKVYDGGTAYSASAANLAALSAALVAGDSVTSAALAFNGKNAGAALPVSLNGVTIADGNNGGNYAVTLAGANSGTITPRPLRVSATGVDRVYDAGVNAAVVFADNRIAGDVLTVTDASATFAGKNVGTAKPVSISGIALGGADAGNYSLAGTTATASASVTPASLAVGGLSVASKPFDGGAGATLNGTASIRPLGNDQVTLAGTPVATYTSTGVGQAAVTISGITLAGADAGNYALMLPAGLTGTITPAAPADAAVPPPVVVAPPALPLPPTSAPLTAPAAPAVASDPATLSSTPPAAVATAALPGAAAAAGVTVLSTSAPVVIAPGSITRENTVTTSAGIAVSLVRELGSQQIGVVAVSIPKDIVKSGGGFTFPLPDQIADAAASAPLRATTASGAALPSWIKYNPDSKAFEATNVPDGGLPIQITVAVGADKATVVISERSD